MSGADQHGTMMIRVAIAAVGVAALLVVMKTVAYIVTDSIAMMASLADSALDVFASFVNLLAIRHALTPADREHRFGHGKAEPLAGLGQGAFIAGSAAFLVIESVSRLIAPHPIELAWPGLIVMGISIVATAALVIAQRIVVARTGSLAVGADRMHYLGDLVTNGGVILGIVLATPVRHSDRRSDHRHRRRRDPVVERGACLPPELRPADGPRIARQRPRQDQGHRAPSRGAQLHDLRTRSAGVHTFIQLHIELDPQMNLMRAHEISDAVEAELCAAFPHAEVIIHQDPAGVETPASGEERVPPSAERAQPKTKTRPQNRRRQSATASRETSPKRREESDSQKQGPQRPDSHGAASCPDRHTGSQNETGTRQGARRPGLAASVQNQR